MACRFPRMAYRSTTRNKETGKYDIAWKRTELPFWVDQAVPCGVCMGCRIQASRHNAMRAAHEASLYENNCFITLTYRPEDLPGPSLDVEAPVLFMKRLRDKFGSGIRSYGCGEYGEKFQRPHFHLLLFNFDFPDKKHFERKASSFGRRYGEKTNPLFRSESLESLWPFGYSSIGELTYESAAYVARYVTKKVSGKKKAEGHYEYVTKEGEVKEREPEQSVCIPQQVGLGRPWLEKYFNDVYPHDFVVFKERKVKPPRFYDRKAEEWEPEMFAKVLRERQRKLSDLREELTIERQCDLEHIDLLNQQKQIRIYEDGEV